jgi:predicted lipid-binding transport protein (Tim44 family)
MLVGLVQQGWPIVKNIRWLAVIAAVIIVAPSLADARAGGGTNSGSRGSNTGQAPAPTQTAPAAKPIERSTTPQPPAQKPATVTPASATPQAGGGFMARNPFLSGLMGGMLGAGLFGMMFGGGFSGGLGGGAGVLGLLLQVMLIGGLAYLAVRLFRGWSAARTQSAAPAYAYATAAQRMNEAVALPSGGGGSGPVLAGSSAALAISAEDFNTFEAMLGEIQTAYSNGDLAKLRSLATPEMLGYFSEELSGNASRGVENKVEAVKLEQGDLSEAWSEAGLDYATVAMRFSMIDTTRRIGDGSMVAGSDKARTEATEVWTFLRSRGGKWILSAIQQAGR